uniref:MATH domain-containing protein n=1 Tax=Macrostomum lignano TaxID=282301 RepID=A0A1I8INQ5_9PLAT
PIVSYPSTSSIRTSCESAKVFSSWRSSSSSISGTSVTKDAALEPMQWGPRGRQPYTKPMKSAWICNTRCTVWFDAFGVLMADYLAEKATINAAYVQDRVVASGSATSCGKPCILCDKSRLHAASATTRKVQGLGFRLLSHPPHSPDLTIADFHSFGAMKKPARSLLYHPSSRMEALKSTLKKWTAALTSDMTNTCNTSLDASQKLHLTKDPITSVWLDQELKKPLYSGPRRLFGFFRCRASGGCSEEAEETAHSASPWRPMTSFGLACSAVLLTGGGEELSSSRVPEVPGEQRDALGPANVGENRVWPEEAVAREAAMPGEGHADCSEVSAVEPEEGSTQERGGTGDGSTGLPAILGVVPPVEMLGISPALNAGVDHRGGDGGSRPQQRAGGASLGQQVGALVAEETSVAQDPSELHLRKPVELGVAVQDGPGAGGAAAEGPKGCLAVRSRMDTMPIVYTALVLVISLVLAVGADALLIFLVQVWLPSRAARIAAENLQSGAAEAGGLEAALPPSMVVAAATVAAAAAEAERDEREETIDSEPSETDEQLWQDRPASAAPPEPPAASPGLQSAGRRLRGLPLSGQISADYSEAEGGGDLPARLFRAARESENPLTVADWSCADRAAERRATDRLTRFAWTVPRWSRGARSVRQLLSPEFADPLLPGVSWVCQLRRKGQRMQVLVKAARLEPVEFPEGRLFAELSCACGGVAKRTFGAFYPGIFEFALSLDDAPGTADSLTVACSAAILTTVPISQLPPLPPTCQTDEQGRYVNCHPAGIRWQLADWHRLAWRPGEAAFSPLFSCAPLPGWLWQVHLYPASDEPSTAGLTSVFLKLVDTDGPAAGPLEADFELALVPGAFDLATSAADGFFDTVEFARGDAHGFRGVALLCRLRAAGPMLIDCALRLKMPLFT